MIGASTIVSFVADLAVGIFKKMFAANRDKENGALEVINKGQSEAISDVQKAQAARSADNSALDSELRIP